jgi:formylglycine-generating enzyme required for sulfatase activity
MKNLIQAAVVTLFAASTAQAQQAVQWRVEDGGNGHWYSLETAGRPWQDQQRSALAHGGHLATLNSSSESAWVRTNLAHGGLLYFGFCQDGADPAFSEPAGGWKWVTGEPVTWFDWCPSEPNNLDVGSGPQNVVQTEGQPWGCVDDTHGLESFPAWIEWSADCNADGIVDYGQILDGSFADVNADGIPDVCQAPCVSADLNNDRSVDGADLGVLLSAWGPAGPESARADINGNGIVDGADLGVLLANWGACGEAPPWATVVQWQPDPAVVTDDQLRSAIAATGLPWRVRDTSTQIEMLLVPPGTFQMGCVMGSSQYGCTQDELPVHQVTLTRAFYLGRYELTQAQWTAQMTSNPSYFQGYPNSSSRPVEQVSWNTIQGYLAVTGFRLPTEAEWEFACRAGTQTPFYNGSADDGAIFEIAWFNLNSGFETKPVGLKSANGFGFHDMLGNVGEWVQDRFAPYTPAPQVDPSQPSGSYVVMRGGGWGQLILRSSYRPYDAPNIVYQGEGGFRVAKTP